MRYIFIVLVSIIFTIHANSQSTPTPKKNTQPVSSETGTVIHIKQKDFLTKVFNYKADKNWKYLGDKPCIVDFYATWCGPCKRVAPILDELAKEFKGKIIIYKIDTDQEQELSTELGISSIPTLLFCPMNGQPQVANGAIPKESFLKVINEVLLKKN